MISFPNSIDPEIVEILSNSTPTEFPGIYESYRKPEINPSLPFLFVLIGPTRSGKTTILNYLSQFYNRIITATSRTRREGEPQEAFVWMTIAKNDEEDIQEYRMRLERTYDLVESNVFAGNVYGIPRISVQNALSKGNSIISVENAGAKTLLDKFSQTANVVVLFILPDGIHSIYERSNEPRENLQERVEKAKIEIKEAPTIAHYFVHNTSTNMYCGDSQNPLENLKINILNFTRDLINKGQKSFL